MNYSYVAQGFFLCLFVVFLPSPWVLLRTYINDAICFSQFNCPSWNSIGVHRIGANFVTFGTATRDLEELLAPAHAHIAVPNVTIHPPEPVHKLLIIYHTTEICDESKQVRFGGN